MSSCAPQTIFLKDYTPAPYKVEHVNLTFMLFEGKSVVKSEVIYVKNSDSNDHDLVLNGQDQTIVCVKLDGASFDGYTIADDKMTISNPAEKFTLAITSEIDPVANTALEGLYQSQGTYCTQC